MWLRKRITTVKDAVMYLNLKKAGGIIFSDVWPTEIK